MGVALCARNHVVVDAAALGALVGWQQVGVDDAQTIARTLAHLWANAQHVLDARTGDGHVVPPAGHKRPAAHNEEAVKRHAFWSLLGGHRTPRTFDNIVGARLCPVEALEAVKLAHCGSHVRVKKSKSETNSSVEHPLFTKRCSADRFEHPTAARKER